MGKCWEESSVVSGIGTYEDSRGLRLPGLDGAASHSDVVELPRDLDATLTFCNRETGVLLVDLLPVALLGRVATGEACYEWIMAERGGEAAQASSLSFGE
jgi:hypothetical protein